MCNPEGHPGGQGSGVLSATTVVEDGATFTNERAITVTDSSMVTNPRIVYDAASKGYKVFWTDGLSGEGRMATLSDLTAKQRSARRSRPTRLRWVWAT